MKLSLSLLLLTLSLTSFIYRCDTDDEDVIEQEVVAERVDPDVKNDDTEAPDNGVVNEISEEELNGLRNSGEKHNFQAEVNRMMDIIVNSLYKTKEIFLRELISNAFDAIDKIRFIGLRNPAALEANPELCIWIKLDPVNRTITIQDSGIGMSKQEMITNLGTIAKSGTKDFIQKMDEMSAKGEIVKGDISSQIGQFGVGLYSVFLVADRVVIASKNNEDPIQHIWEADSSSYNIYDDPRGDTLKRGTSVTLFLNQDSSEFLEERRITQLIGKYSEFIDFHIKLWSKINDDGKEVAYHWKHVNNIRPIWMRAPSDISEAEYNEFFNRVYYGKEKESYAKPSAVIHFTAEGEIRFTVLIFIPDKLPKKYVDSQLTWETPISLYVKRVRVTSDTKEYLPHYLSYLGGIIDSDGLPLNVGRESLQHNQLIKIVRKKLVRKILDHLKKMSMGDHDEYSRFYHEFGNAIKFGILDDQANANRVARLLRFYSSTSPTNYTSLDDYISRMKPGQPAIYYLTASSVEDAQKSPYLERLDRKGYEVLFMVDNIDESVMQNLRVYENKGIQHIGKEGNEVSASKTEEKLLKVREKEYEPLLSWLRTFFTKNRISSIRLSTRMVTSSCLLIATENGYSGNMDRIIRSQAYVHGRESGYDEVLNQPKNLEINPFHPLAKVMLKIFNEDPDSRELKTAAETCLSVATMSGGYTIHDRVKFASFIERIYLNAHNIDYDNINQQIYDELGIEEEEEKEEDKHEEVSDHPASDSEESNDENSPGESEEENIKEEL